jgi:HAMP domain-containing protein
MLTLSIKAKVSAVSVLCLGTFGAILVGLSDASYRRNVRVLSEQSLVNARSTFASLEDADVAKMSVAAQLLMVNPELRQIFADRDRAKLIAASEPIFKSLRESYGVTILNYIDPEEKRFLTMTDTKDTRLIGTKAVRFNVQECARRKTWVTGLALGQLGFALRVTHPFYDTGTLQGGQLLGYIELGSEIAGFVGALKKQTGQEYGLVVQKGFLKENDWKIQRERFKLRNNWEDQKAVVLAANTWKDESIFAYDGDIASLPDQGQTIDQIVKTDAIFSRSVFPIKDASGTKVGAVFVLVDITSMYRELQTAKWRTITTTAALIVFICAILLFMLSRLVFRRLAAITQVATRLVGGDYNSPVTTTSHDEVGAFERLFEQLRAIFVSLIEECERLNKLTSEKKD